jgi:signal transduction histidine kinase
MTPSVIPQGVPRERAIDDVMRAVAHEIRQPLGAIESIAYYLTLVLPPGDGKAQEQLSRIQQLVDQANWILTSGLQLSESDSAPAPIEEPVSLEEWITEAIAAQSGFLDPPPSRDLSGGPALVLLNPGQCRALAHNLLALFRGLATAAHPMRIRTEAQASGALLEISTTATGYGSEAALGAGAVLGLDAARRVAESRGGRLTCHIDPSAGIRVQVMLP